MEAKSLGRWIDPTIYGIDWDADDEAPRKKPKQLIREKPFCEIEECSNRVSTEHGRPKPFCKDHVFENPYVQDLVKRIAALDDKADRKQTKEAFKRAELEYNARRDSDPVN